MRHAHRLFALSLSVAASCAPPEPTAPEPAAVAGPAAPAEVADAAGATDAGLAGTPPPPPSNALSPIGTNFTQFRDWASEFAFVDAFRRARPFSCGAGCALDVDEHGWVRSLRPGQTASTAIFTAPQLAGKYPAGRYTVLYEGQGWLNYFGATRDAAASTPGRDVIDVVNTGTFGLSITSTNPANYLRNIRVIMPGGSCGDVFTYAASAAACPAGPYQPFTESYASQPFHPLFLARSRPYSLIRPMWWMLPSPYVQPMRVTTPLEWSDRPQLDDATWNANKGVPVEILVQLANTLHADVWFSIPHLATDAYVRSFAAYVRDRLHSSLRAYVEHSNEVWNGGPGGYEQAEYAKARGAELGLAPWDPYLAQLRYHSRRSVQIFRLWNEVYGGRSPRVVRVLGSMGGNPWTGVQIMDFEGAAGEADALAIAPYFNVLPADEGTVAGYASVDQLFTYLEGTVLPGVVTQIQNNAANAQARGLELVAYEGGQHLVERGMYQSNANLNRLYHDANRDPRMGALYGTLLSAWRQGGGHLFTHFVNVMQYDVGGVGRFGALESMFDEHSPKYDALLAFIQGNPRWW